MSIASPTVLSRTSLEWGWLLNARDARLITGHGRFEIQVPHPPDFVPEEALSKATFDKED